MDVCMLKCVMRQRSKGRWKAKQESSVFMLEKKSNRFHGKIIEDVVGPWCFDTGTHFFFTTLCRRFIFPEKEEWSRLKNLIPFAEDFFRFFSQKSKIALLFMLLTHVVFCISPVFVVV